MGFEARASVRKLTMRYFVCVTIALIGTLGTQTPPARPQFDVASVKRAAKGERNPRLSQLLREV
jgi:hypothetical protein